MIIAGYFAGPERTLRRNPQVSKLEEPFTCLASDDFNGLVRGRVTFWDGSYLDRCEVISTELGYPVRISCAYTYLNEGRRIFRYDNAPHHPEIVTFPHHKHIGPQDCLTPADQPGLNSVLQEVAAWLTAQ